MTRSPHSGNEQEPYSHPRLWLLILGRASIVLGVLLLMGIVGGGFWLRNYVYKDLAPLVEQNLTQLLGRPVALGKVERFSLNSLRFGSLSIPATQTDPDRVTAKGVEVQFSPLRLLFTRTLQLNVTLVQPDVYIQQDKQGQWVTTQLQTGEGRGFIQTELNTIRVRDGDVVLDPIPRPGKPNGSVALDQVNGQARILSQQGLSYQINALPTRGGTIQITGDTQLKTLFTKLKVQAQNFQAADLSRLIELPIVLQAGQINGDLAVQLQQTEPEISLNGTATVNQVTAQIQNVPQKFFNANGRLTFQGQQVAFEELSANYGKVPLIATGTLNTQTGYDIAAKVPAVTAKTALDTLNIPVPVPIAGELQANILLSGAIQQPVLSGTASTLQPAQIDRVLFSNISSGFRLSVSKEASRLAISNLRLIPAVGGQIVGGGEVTLGNQSNVKIDLQAEGVPADPLAQNYGFSPPITIGNVLANAQVTGSLDNKQPLVVTLSKAVATPQAGGQITASGNIQLAQQGNVNIDIQAQGVPGNAIAQGYNVSVPLNIGGVFANATVTGTIGNQPLEVVVSSVRATPEVGGQITANGRVQLAPQGRVSLNVEAENLPGDAIAKAYNSSPPITIGNVSADAKVSGTLQDLRAVAQVQAPAATYPTTGQVVVTQQGNNILFRDAVAKVAGGIVRARGQLGQKRWTAFVDAQGIQLNRFAQLPPQLQQGLLSSELSLAGSTESFQPSTIQATGQANLRQVAGGTVNLRDITLNNGRWSAVANAAQIELNRFSEQLRGRLNSKLRVAGTTESFQLADIHAAGQVRFSQLAVLEKPLTAQIAWNGQQIIVERATAPGLSANGTIAVQVPETGTPQVTAFNLDVRAQGYNLQQTPFEVPGNIAVAGLVDFTGQVTGTPDVPLAQGNVQLRNFNVNGLAFDPVLTGRVNFQGGQGTELNLSGTQDRIVVNLGSDYRPVSFFIQRDDAVATGKTQGDTLLVNVQDFPVAVLESVIPGDNLNVKPLRGEISGNLALNLDNFAVTGNVAINNPQLGRFAANAFQGNISFANGTASLTGGNLQIGGDNIAVSANVQTTGNNPQFDAQVSFDQARVQRILQAFNVFAYQDLAGGLQIPELAGAEVLTTTPVSLPDADLLTQLRWFSKFAMLVAQEQNQREEQQTLPTLAELQGTLSGQIAVAGSLQSGLNANFNIQSSNLDWGQYDINQFIAQGSFTDGVVTLSPLRIQLDEGLLAFSGQLGTNQLSGQLQVSSLPLSLLQPFIERYPVDVTGQVNAVANLSGSLENPNATGELTLQNATINQEPVQKGQLSFDYNDARLNFASTVLVTGTQPLQLQGNIPFALPFASTQPASNQISITANVQDEGLALLNVFTDQVNWVSGQGQVNVDIGGTLNQPIITGTAAVQNATFKTAALTEELTDVTGLLQFNGNWVDIESLQGQYNEGQLTAAGIIPIYATQQAQQQAASNPLSVSLNNLDLNVQGLYQGGVSGNVTIAGTVFNPEIGGEIQLSDGKVVIGETANTQATTATSTSGGQTENTITITPDSPSGAQTGSTTATSPSGAQTGSTTATSPSGGQTGNATTVRPPIDFNNLRLVLGDDVNVTTQPLFGFVPGVGNFSQPILSFTAKGDLTINGTLANPIPQGVIRLTGGQVNLFTTQFTLERGYEHTAKFTPRGGLDPVLDVRLVAFVPETSGSLVTGNRILSSPFSSEISDIPTATNIGTLRTIRVEARATGPASQLAENLELTSEPGRSEAEIIALLGGSIINTLGQSDAALGIATLASSTVLGELQGSISSIGQAIGFSEFRIYPTTVANAASQPSVLGLAAEGVFDVTGDLSVSLSRIFLTNEPFIYSLLYRLNDNILVRGATDLEDDSRFQVEYETRF